MRITKDILKTASLLRFKYFERSIHPQTRAQHTELLRWAEEYAKHAERTEQEDAYAADKDPIVSQGCRLRGEVLTHFHGKQAMLGKKIRILIHTPSARKSPGGFSLFRNLALSLEYIGIPARMLDWDEPIEAALSGFEPTVFISSDAEEYIARIDWAGMAAYRKTKRVLVGLTASLEEYGNTPLPPRLRWAKEHGVDFYYSFRSPEYLSSRSAYRPFFDEGYRILSVEFGANPLVYYPVPGIARDLHYVFLASNNADKRERYYEYLAPIFQNFSGLIDGPGWTGVKKWSHPDIHRFLYARAKVGINLHISDSIDWPSELNERTYILAACGVPQLVDDARLLSQRFSADAMFVAKNPTEYVEMFLTILENQALAERRALQTQKEVFIKHTTLHRAENFALNLRKILNIVDR